jgi:hypothetical protein
VSKFIDISGHNIITDYDILTKQDLKGVIIKATEGTTYKDSMCPFHYAKLATKIDLGFYHYLSAYSSADTQAQNFWETIKNFKFTITPVLDVESEDLSKMGIAQDYASRFKAVFKQLSGCDVMIYSGEAYIKENFDDSFIDNNVFWVANYSKMPSIPNIVAWQYTDQCRDYRTILSGVDCSVLNDENKFYINGGKKVNDIVVYGEGADKRAGEYLADFLKCPVIALGNVNGAILTNYKNVYMIGGAIKPVENAILLSGGDRFETLRVVMDFISKYFK